MLIVTFNKNGVNIQVAKNTYKVIKFCIKCKVKQSNLFECHQLDDIYLK